MKPNEVVVYFIEKFNLSPNKQEFMRYLGQCKALLKKYEDKEIVKVIDYLYIYPPKSRVYSFGFLQYVMEDTLNKIKTLEIKKENQNKISDFTIDDNKMKINYNKNDNPFTKKGLIKF